MNKKHIGSGERDIKPRDLESRKGFSQDAQDAIGKQLRRAYGRLVSEPLPERFIKLLEELGKSDKPESKS